jgi:hypothetical protein
LWTAETTTDESVTVAVNTTLRQPFRKRMQVEAMPYQERDNNAPSDNILLTTTRPR